MDIRQELIEQKLKANVIIDKCMHCKHIIFRDSWCSQDRIIRFTTPFFRQITNFEQSEKGKWKTGDFVMFEISNSPDSFVINCVFSCSEFSYVNEELKAKLRFSVSLSEDNSNEFILQSWDLSGISDNNKLFDEIDVFLNNRLPGFEKTIQEKLIEYENTGNEMKEGNKEYIVSSKYERNPKARAACLAAHGTACSVCGIDFGKAYGAAFDGMIEVHHIVPLSQIGKEYVVDPVKDLIPVCPNCHAALHSKKDGVYTVSELKALKNNSKA